MEELKNVAENMVEVEVIDVPVEKTGNGFFKPLGIAAGIVATGVGVFVCKKRKVIENWKINSLRKRGYQVYKTECIDVQASDADK